MKAKTLLLISWSLLLVFLVFLQARQIFFERKYMVGIFLEESQEGLQISRVMPGSPAQKGGIKVGDVLVKVQGNEVHHIQELHFEGKETLWLTLKRGNTFHTVKVNPGMPFPFIPFLSNLFALIAYWLLGLWVASQPGEPIPKRLLFGFSQLVALELALPAKIAFRNMDIALLLFYALSIFQFLLEIHLVALIPKPHPWLRQSPQRIKWFYAGGIFLLLFCLWIPLQNSMNWHLIPLTDEELLDLFNNYFLSLWLVFLIFLLISQAKMHPSPKDRHKVYLVFLGILPWALLIIFLLVTQLLGYPSLIWVENIWGWVLFPLPLTLGWAIYRYHLLNLSGVVQKGFVFGFLTMVLLSLMGLVGGLTFYIYQEALPKTPLVIVALGIISFCLGLSFYPLRRWINQMVERRFFPEKLALRQKLLTLAEDLPAIKDLDALGTKVLQGLEENLEIKESQLYGADPSKGILYPLKKGEQPIEMDDPLIERMVLWRKPFFIKDLPHLSRSSLWRYMLDKGMEVALPLMVVDKLTGLLLLGRKKDGTSLSGEEIHMLLFFAQNVALTLDHIKLRTWATYDGLTGLLRREPLTDLLQREVQRACRYNRPFSLILFDMDNLKGINDTYGHIAGDMALKTLGNYLQTSFRSTDYVGRWGGDEFLAVCPETPCQEAQKAVERIQKKLTLPNPSLFSDAYHPSVSCGIISFKVQLTNPSPQLIEQLMQWADALLYEAKSLGGDTALARDVTQELKAYAH